MDIKDVNTTTGTQVTKAKLTGWKVERADDGSLSCLHAFVNLYENQEKADNDEIASNKAIEITSDLLVFQASKTYDERVTFLEGKITSTLS